MTDPALAGGDTSRRATHVRYGTARFLVHVSAGASVSALALTPWAAPVAAVLVCGAAVLGARGKSMHLVALLVVAVPYSGVYFVGVPATAWVLGAGGAVLALRALAGGGAPRQLPRAAAALLLLGLVVLPQALATPPTTAQAAFMAAETAVLLLAVVVLSILPSATGEASYSVEVAFCGLALAAGLSALYEAGRPEAEYALTRQLVSLVGGSNYAALLVAAAAVLVVRLWQQGMLASVVALGLGAFFLYVPVALGSRTATFVLVAVVTLLLARSRGRSLARAVAVAVPLALVAWWGSGLLASRLTASHLVGSFDDRLLLWSTSADLARQHWLTGAGSEGLVQALMSVSRTWYPHSFLLSWTAQFGVVAGLVVAAVLVPLGALALRSPASAAYLTIVLGSLAEPAVDTHRVGLVALALTVPAMASRRRKEAPSGAGPRGSFPENRCARGGPPSRTACGQ